MLEGFEDACELLCGEEAVLELKILLWTELEFCEDDTALEATEDERIEDAVEEEWMLEEVTLEEVTLEEFTLELWTDEEFAEEEFAEEADDPSSSSSQSPSRIFSWNSRMCSMNDLWCD